MCHSNRWHVLSACKLAQELVLYEIYNLCEKQLDNRIYFNGLLITLDSKTLVQLDGVIFGIVGCIIHQRPNYSFELTLHRTAV